jgi:hypothetical protein
MSKPMRFRWQRVEMEQNRFSAGPIENSNQAENEQIPLT